MPLYDLPLRTLAGEPTTLRELAGGGPVLVVNVASRCGLTPQYATLERLHEQTPGLTVVGVPCNQFGGQEPGSAEEIATFCSATYGVTFPLLDKTEVNGPGRSALFHELASVPDPAGEAGDVQWNFEKWLVSAQGEPVARFRPRTEPDSPEVVDAVRRLLPDGA
ncbi:MAG TPA: glutathione peroxidase [Mycobacteriales bacterium]|jgi:glutathione peroxidase|nr:glutathione peroxidase [Mycobacteriales bacterium]